MSFLTVLAYYIHHLDPVLIDFSSAIKLRWYGLAYLAAFLVGFLLLKRLGDKKLWVLPGNMAADFITAAAFFGVFLGGRLGYMLFYTIPDKGWGILAEDPLLPLKVWEGGMASHGGIIGLMIFTFVYMKRKQVSWTGLGDGLCVVAPLGLMFGRFANFINGELYGRAADVAWAIRFPSTLWDGGVEESSRQSEVVQSLLAHNPNLSNMAGYTKSESGIYTPFLDRDLLLDKIREDEAVRDIVGEHLIARHPSQLYEAFFEGALLFAILYFIRVKFPRLKHGILTGLFFVLYALGRIFCELFRQPDYGDTFLIGLTRGQFLSTFMIAIGLGFIIYGVKKGGNAPDDRLEYDKREVTE